MTNFENLLENEHEKIKNALLYGLAVDKNGNIGDCGFCSTNSSIECEKCSFNVRKSSCYEERKKWLEKECIDLHVGDIIKIVSPGLCYSTYAKWVIENVDDKDKIARYSFNCSPSQYDLESNYRILAIAAHEDDSDRMLAYIQEVHGDSCKNKCFLFDLRALKKVRGE